MSEWDRAWEALFGKTRASGVDALKDALTNKRAEDTANTVRAFGDHVASVSAYTGETPDTTLARAIGLLHAVVQHVRDGGRVEFVSADGTRKKLSIPHLGVRK